MARPIRVLDDAEAEVVHAATIYAIESPRLANRFLKIYSETLRFASEFPDGGSAQQFDTPHNVQAFYVDVFPYTVFAVVRPAEVVIVAVTHQGQEPGYWLDRLDDIDS